jgi:hypothetical protein
MPFCLLSPAWNVSDCFERRGKVAVDVFSQLDFAPRSPRSDPTPLQPPNIPHPSKSPMTPGDACTVRSLGKVETVSLCPDLAAG